MTLNCNAKDSRLILASITIGNRSISRSTKMEQWSEKTMYCLLLSLNWENSIANRWIDPFRKQNLSVKRNRCEAFACTNLKINKIDPYDAFGITKTIPFEWRFFLLFKIVALCHWLKLLFSYFFIFGENSVRSFAAVIVANTLFNVLYSTCKLLLWPAGDNLLSVRI